MDQLDPAEQRALVLLERYESTIRRDLETLDSNLIPELDAAAAMLRLAVSAKREVRVGFLGEAQVGKSSLINALLGRVALPTGGVGPLTAQATRLRYASVSALDARYHDRRRLNQFVFAIRQYLAARGELMGAPELPDSSADEDATSAAWSSATAVEVEPTKGSTKNATGEYLLGQARLMLGAGEDVARTVVHDALRSALGQEPLGEAALLAPFGPRIAQIAELLGATVSVTADANGPEGFFEALQENAAGWRSPLVAELDLALDVPLLSRVEVVDLPGVGVVGDPAGHVAEEFVRDDAAALVIVVRNNGLTEEVVGLLERTGVVTRLLFASDGSRVPPIHVVFAITRLDDVADDRWKQERQAAKSKGLVTPKREEVFKRLSEDMARKAREQVRHVLDRSPQFEDLASEQRERREKVVRQLCERMEVICVSAKDYMNLQDEDDRPRAFLQDEAATNIPYFRERLAELAESARGSRRGRIQRALESFRDLLRTHLDALAMTPRGSAASSDATRFRGELDRLVPDFRKRATDQRRAVTAYLMERIPPKLDVITENAADRARRQLTRLRRTGDGLHWQSLNAALLRNGTWDKRNIDYAGDLTRSFVEVIAASWEPSVLDEVRRVVRKLVEDHVELVEEFLGEASKLSGSDTLLAQIQAQERVLKEQGKSAVEWTADHLAELSEDIRKRIGGVVAKPIERACRDAVARARTVARARASASSRSSSPEGTTPSIARVNRRPKC